MMTAKQLPISKSISRWCFFTALISLIFGILVCTVFLLLHIREDIKSLLQQEIQDVQMEISDVFESFMRETPVECARILEMEDPETLTAERLQKLMEEKSIAEINVVNRDGVVTASSVPDSVGYQMADGEQSAAFLCLLQGVEIWIQDGMSIAKNERAEMRYIGVPFQNGNGFLLIGIDVDSVSTLLKGTLAIRVRHEHVGKDGFMMISGPDNIVLCCINEAYEGKPVPETVSLDTGDELHISVLDHAAYFSLVNETNGYRAIGFYSMAEAMAAADDSVIIAAILSLTTLTELTIVLRIGMKKHVVKGVVELNETLSAIAEGDLNRRAQVTGTLEFAQLSDDINRTVDALKGYIAREASRIDQELAYAKGIQRSSLPFINPPFPEHKEFDLFAEVETAREVGGDFYDYYLLNDQTLGFLVADVSGKGIPAAMFMMRGKTLLRDYAEGGDSPKEVFTHANAILNSGNETSMFITAWMGFLDTETGTVRFVNAGHNPPVLIRNGQAQFIKQKSGLILAIMEQTAYKEQTLQLEPGDILFLYTDGVTEANNEKEERYGEERLLRLLTGLAPEVQSPCESVCRLVTEDMKRFTGSAAQFDDITMLCLYYAGMDQAILDELTLDAVIENTEQALEFIDSHLEAAGCALKTRMKIVLAVEELFVNIAKYAYGAQTGTVTLRLEIEQEPRRAVITLIDRGVPHDPLTKEYPESPISADERQFDDLGFYIAKTYVDEMVYSYQKGQNILTIKKNLD